MDQNRQTGHKQADDRLTELEAKIAHQEHALHEMSDEIYAQQKKLEQLEVTCDFLLEQVRSQSEGPAAGNPADEKPPHY